jgi:hypothetical protein
MSVMTGRQSAAICAIALAVPAGVPTTRRETSEHRLPRGEITRSHVPQAPPREPMEAPQWPRFDQVLARARRQRIAERQRRI